MTLPVPNALDVADNTGLADFRYALEERRDKVYDYLEGWPGAEQFQPADIYDGIFSYIKRRGKALRPLVLLLSCAAVGGDEDQALPAAAAVEVFHTWTLVHDDIIDRDATRRGSPTVHEHYTRHAHLAHGMSRTEAAHYGTAVAILTGDLQQSWCYDLLGALSERGVQPELILGLIRRMAGVLTPQLMEGEMLDVQFSLMPHEELSEADIVRMLTRKTGALLEYAAWCGGILGTGDLLDREGHAARLARFASLCGTAFQLQDDLLGLTADEGLLGKPVGSDLREGKRTLIVHRALRKADAPGRDAILKVLGNQLSTSSEISLALDMIRASGAIDDIGHLANEYVSQALNELTPLADSSYKTLLCEWAKFLLARDH
ncbi:MAG: polyprenyl synthetase family protein [Chloroflexia bacterium]